MAATRHSQIMKRDTKDFITTALLQMLIKENLSNLTVSKVCTRAGVSRMAFYRNFDGLEQIIYDYYKPKIESVFDVICKCSNDSEKFNIQLNFFNEFGDSFILSIERGFEPIIQQIFIEEIKKFYSNDCDEYFANFMCAGVYATWKKWLLDGRKKPLKEIMEFLKLFDTIK